MSIYDPNIWDKKVPANVIGGRNRSLKARRDKLGRFMPNDQVGQELWSLDPQHGKPGGVGRAIKAMRDERGRFKARQTIINR